MRSKRLPLLLYLASAREAHHTAVAPALAAGAERAGWAFELYYDDLRGGRHFGGGDPDTAAHGQAAGSLVAGGRHVDQLLWLATAYELFALGDPDSILWPAVEAAGGEALVRSLDPAEVFAAAFDRLGQPLPSTALVLDASPQGNLKLVVAPYLYPAFFVGEPALGMDVRGGEHVRRDLERLGVEEFRGLYLEPARAAQFSDGLDWLDGDAAGKTYASLTASVANRHAAWGRGVLLGDPDLVAAQLPKACRLRLLPLYGRPQTAALERATELVANGEEPVYGRQYDDQDFFTLARLGRGLQVVDPTPPLDAAHRVRERIPDPPRPLWDTEPGDAQLEEWANEGTVLVTLLFWSGMLRELDCLPRLIDLVAATGLRGGLVITTATIEYAAGSSLPLLAVPPERGGVFGLLEPLLGCTGHGVAAETLLPAGSLASSLRSAQSTSADRLPAGIAPRGWWPLLDAPLVAHRSRRIEWRSRRPIVRFTARAPLERSRDDVLAHASGDLRSRVGRAVRGSKLEMFFEARRPFDDSRPGSIDEAVAEAVCAAGFSYMWSKASFGRPRVVFRRGEFVALPFTAGNWDGWSPFYTAAAPVDVTSAERRLLRAGRPGWLATTIDSPLWTLPGELLEHGTGLFRIAELVARGGRTGRLINVTPHVVARYARLLDERRLERRDG